MFTFYSFPQTSITNFPCGSFCYGKFTCLTHMHALSKSPTSHVCEAMHHKLKGKKIYLFESFSKVLTACGSKIVWYVYWGILKEARNNVRIEHLLRHINLYGSKITYSKKSRLLSAFPTWYYFEESSFTLSRVSLHNYSVSKKFNKRYVHDVSPWNKYKEIKS